MMMKINEGAGDINSIADHGDLELGVTKTMTIVNG